MYKLMRAKENMVTDSIDIELTYEERKQIESILTELFCYCTTNKLKGFVGLRELGLQNYVRRKNIFNGFKKISNQTYNIYSWSFSLNECHHDKNIQRLRNKILNIMGKKKYDKFFTELSYAITHNFN